jgi:hypothetical protein
MPKEYRDVLNEEEEEPLTGEDGASRRIWRLEKDHLATRLRILSLRWPWIAHGVLLSVSFAFLALSLYVRLSTQSDPLLATYCTLSLLINSLMNERGANIRLQHPLRALSAMRTRNSTCLQFQKGHSWERDLKSMHRGTTSQTAVSSILHRACLNLRC